MTTSLVSSTISHATDAGFRAWVRQFNDQLQAVGLVRVEGTFNYDTAVKPSGGSYAGYEVYRFDDALQASRPIFIKLEFGTNASSASSPAVRVTTGTGTVSAGAISTPHVAITLSRAQNLEPTAATAKSYACKQNAVGGFFFSGWVGAFIPAASASTTHLSFGVFRTCDDDGTPNGDGYAFFYNSAHTIAHYMHSWVTNTTSGNLGSNYTHIPLTLTNGVVGTDVQVFRHYVAAPRVRSLCGTMTYFKDDITEGTPFTAVPAGTTPRTYMAGGSAASASSVSQSATHVFAWIWE